LASEARPNSRGLLSSMFGKKFKIITKSRPITRATEIEPLMGNPIKEETAVLLRIQLFPPLESSNNLVYGL